MGLHQTKMLMHKKRNFNKTKQQPIELEMIFATNSSDTGLIFKTYKELNTKQANRPIKNVQSP